MTIPVPCACGKELHVKEERAGQRLRCPACNAIVTVPASAADGPRDPERKRRGRRRRPAEKAVPWAWIIGGSTAAGVLLIGLLVAVWWMFAGPAPQQPKTATPVAGLSTPATAPEEKRTEPAPTPPEQPKATPAEQPKPQPPPPMATQPQPPPPKQTMPEPPPKPVEKEPAVAVKEIRKLQLPDRAMLSGAALSPDGKRVAASGSALGGVAVPGLKVPGKSEVQLWDSETGMKVAGYSIAKQAVVGLSFSADGKRVLFGCDDGLVRHWDPATGKEVKYTRGHTGQVGCVAFSPDGLRAASGNGETSPDQLSGRDPFPVRMWNTATGAELTHFKGHTRKVTAVVFSPDGKRLLTASWDQTLKLWNPANGMAVRTFTGHTGVVQCAAFSPDGRFILSGGADKTLRLWEVETGTELKRLDESVGSVNGVAFLPDNRHAISGAGGEFAVTTLPGGGVQVKTSIGKAQAVRLWDLETGKVVCDFPAHPFAVTHVAVSADGRRALTACYDGSLYLWELPEVAKLPAKEPGKP